ncbi:helix-turn-helix domain-containing protein [Arcobacter lacus]|uniref:helix-turn-helix domain-containing protein n=1 Tax=Arcobacter lacus TaxID=1912876 RepID=UPI0021BAD70C|nr:helix-turn-helix domain-containing protein [Arcobacter lacus]MCT7908308.1 helix-turn-helix domain-containing protein [Arcobacter lacus]MCT7910796.1 helix-turn-helix domain-containing protein [Arcobacter lacus]
MFQFKTFKPNYKLEKWVKSYWFVNYEQTLDEIEKEKVILPYDNVCLLMIIDIKKNLSYSNKTLNRGIYICPPSLNIHNLNLDSNIYYIDISLFPGVFYKLFGIPVSKLEDRVYEIKELSLNFDVSILDLLYELKGSTLSSLNTLDEYLFKIFQNMQEDSLLSNLYEFTKNPNLENFYNQNRLSIRQIQRKVKDFTGLAPKSIEKINRFYGTLKLIKSNKNSIDFKNIAVENNFYDQSSFIKEFKYFTGITPTLFLLQADDFLQYKCNIFC